MQSKAGQGCLCGQQFQANAGHNSFSNQVDLTKDVVSANPVQPMARRLNDLLVLRRYFIAWTPSPHHLS